MDFLTNAKNIASGLAVVSTLAYVSGYLALRARAHVLGTDPAFTLVYEGYVFTGFRFLFITLIVLIILAPAIFGIRSASLWLVGRIPAHLFPFVQWLALTLLALATIMTLKILSVNGLLLNQTGLGASSSALEQAIMGGQPALRFLLTFVIVLLATLSALWLLKMRHSNSNDTFVWALGFVFSIQLFMLPIYHGALFADRKVRILAAIPDSVKGISAPLGIIDRTSEHITLLGNGVNGNRLLVSIKLDDLNGIPIEKIVNLKEFLGHELAASENSGITGTSGPLSSHDKQESNESKQPDELTIAVSNVADFDETFFGPLVDYLQVTFEAIGSLSNTSVEAGQLWSVEINASGTPSEPRRIGFFDNLAWPVVGPDGQTIYAIQQGRVVRLGKDGKSTEAISIDSNWVKLLGVTKDYSVLGFVFERNEAKPAVLTSNGDINVDRTPPSDERQLQIDRLLQEDRSYIGNRTLFVETSTRGGRGIDVFLKSEGKTLNLSDCGNDSCGQASLSADFRLALFIRQPYY